MHDSYFDPKTIELRAYRVQAEKRLRGDMHNEPEDTVIHYHAFGEPCTRMVSVKGHYLQKQEYLQHEVYSNDPRAKVMFSDFSDTGATATDG